jgi:hypothetical protein
MKAETELSAAPPESSPRSIVPMNESRIVPDPAALERHRRKCQVCRHPDREDIEWEYTEWFKPSAIARHYQIDERSLYRHLEAVGLTSRRRANLRGVLENILQRGAEVPITGNTIIRAVKAFCSLTDDNQWQEPAKISTFKVQTEPNLSPKAPAESSPLLGEGSRQP